MQFDRINIISCRFRLKLLAQPSSTTYSIPDRRHIATGGDRSSHSPIFPQRRPSTDVRNNCESYFTKRSEPPRSAADGIVRGGWNWKESSCGRDQVMVSTDRSRDGISYHCHNRRRCSQHQRNDATQRSRYCNRRLRHSCQDERQKVISMSSPSLSHHCRRSQYHGGQAYNHAP